MINIIEFSLVFVSVVICLGKRSSYAHSVGAFSYFHQIALELLWNDFL